MKRIIFILLLLVSLSAGAQLTTQYLGSPKTLVYNTGLSRSDSAQFIPMDTVMRSYWPKSLPAIASKNGQFYLWSTTLQKWVPSSVDTSIMATRARLYKVVDSLSYLYQPKGNFFINGATQNLLGNTIITGGANPYLLAFDVRQFVAGSGNYTVSTDAINSVVTLQAGSNGQTTRLYNDSTEIAAAGRGLRFQLGTINAGHDDWKIYGLPDTTATISVLGMTSDNRVLKVPYGGTYAGGGVDSVYLKADTLKYNKNSTAFTVSKVAKYNFTALKNGDFLKYDSLNSQWINTSAPSGGGGTSGAQRFDSVQVISSNLPASGNIAIRTADSALLYNIGAGAWMLVKGTLIGTSAPTGGVSGWQTVSNMTVSGNTLTATADGGYGLAYLALPSGINGSVRFTVNAKVSTNKGTGVLAFDQGATAEGSYTTFEHGIYAYTGGTGTPTINTVLSGVNTDSGISAPDGTVLQMRRSGSTMVYEYSTDGGTTFTTIRSVTASTTGTLNVKAWAYRVTFTIDNITGVNLQ